MGMCDKGIHFIDANFCAVFLTCVTDGLTLFQAKRRLALDDTDHLYISEAAKTPKTQIGTPLGIIKGNKSKTTPFFTYLSLSNNLCDTLVIIPFCCVHNILNHTNEFQSSMA